MEELAKLEAERGNPEYLEGGKAEQGLKGKHTESGYIHAGRSENGFAEGRRRGQGSINSGRKRTDRGMQQENMGKNRQASNEMCTFLILNISSLQLIPVNMIAYRAQYGSANPTAIIVPAIAATLFSSFVAVVYCKLKDHGKGSEAYGRRGNIGRGKMNRKEYSLSPVRRKGRGGKAV